MEKLDKFLEEKFIPNNIVYKRVEHNNEQKYVARVLLTRILHLKKSREEKQYIIDYLMKKGIQVIGYSNCDAIEFDNFIYTRHFKKRISKSITSEETLEKLKLYNETNDINIRNEIVLGNMKLVNYALVNIIKDYHIDMSDLEQAGYIGLINAVDYYDSTKGAFSTYALSCIANAIRIQLYQLNGLKLSEYCFYNIQKQVEHEYGEKLINNPNLSKVIVSKLSESGFRSKKHENENLRRVLLNNCISLDEVLEKGEDEHIYSIDYDYNDSDINEVYDKELNKHIVKQLSALTERQRKTLELRYGLNNGNVKTLKEIAEVLGVSLQRVAQYEKEGLKMLNENEAINSLRSYLVRER